MSNEREDELGVEVIQWLNTCHKIAHMTAFAQINRFLDKYDDKLNEKDYTSWLDSVLYVENMNTLLYLVVRRSRIMEALQIMSLCCGNGGIVLFVN